MTNTLRVDQSDVAESDPKKRTRCLIEDVDVVSPFGILRARFSGDVSTSRWTKKSSQKVLRAGQNDHMNCCATFRRSSFAASARRL